MHRFQWSAASAMQLPLGAVNGSIITVLPTYSSSSSSSCCMTIAVALSPRRPCQISVDPVYNNRCAWNTAFWHSRPSFNWSLPMKAVYGSSDREERTGWLLAFISRLVRRRAYGGRSATTFDWCDQAAAVSATQPGDRRAAAAAAAW